MKEEVKTDKAQSAKGLLSQALVSNGFIFTSGFIHVAPDWKLVEGSTEDKFKQVVRLGGFEPPTISLRGSCSTTELQPQIKIRKS